jgi:sec-independent protein translocase protein TatA
MPFLNGGHLWLILLLMIVLVVFGPKRLPELGSSVGRAISEFRKSTTQLKNEIGSDHAEPATQATTPSQTEATTHSVSENSTAAKPVSV